MSHQIPTKQEYLKQFPCGEHNPCMTTGPFCWLNDQCHRVMRADGAEAIKEDAHEAEWGSSDNPPGPQCVAAVLSLLPDHYVQLLRDIKEVGGDPAKFHHYVCQTDGEEWPRNVSAFRWDRTDEGSCHWNYIMDTVATVRALRDSTNSRKTVPEPGSKHATREAANAHERQTLLYQ